MKNCNFSLAQLHLQNEGFAKRAVIKNDTVITIYKDRYYHFCLSTGIRYPYVPTNSDLQANDWELIFMLDEEIQKLSLKNSLNEQLRKF